MKPKYISIIITLLILLVAALTNPGEEIHRARVERELNSLIPDSLNATFGQVTTPLFDAAIDKFIHRQNFVFFSLTKLDLETATRIIGIGLFGHVFLISSPKEAFESERDKLQKLIPF